jgi:hypothetical protein
LLTGKEPLEIRMQGMPSDVRIPLKLRNLLNQMMESDPNLRPASMVEVKSALLDLDLPITPFIFPDSHRAVFLE